MNYEQIVKLLKAEVLPTMGCTEPGAVALAAAYASEAMCTGTISKIEVTVNSNIYKNGVAVGIPGTGETGLEIAAALGVIKKHSEKQLSVLSDVSKQELALAQEMIKQGVVVIQVDESKAALWVNVRLESTTDWCEALITDKHTNLVSIRKNGEYLLNMEQAHATEKVDYRIVLRGKNVTIAEMVKTIENIPLAEINFLLDGVTMNLRAAERGLSQQLGMGIGAKLEEMVRSGVLSDDIVSYAKILTVGAADARMSGDNINIMSSAGSGNHGITVILPVYAVSKKLNVSEERMIRAIALSHLVTIYVKIQTGNLSALCGCAVAAATGASAAIAWLLGGDATIIGNAIKNVIANLTGMICDGGKVGCALKLSTAAATAVESALLAQGNIVVPDSNGIIADTVEDTIVNLGRVSNPGMLQTDKVIMDVMLAKEGRASVS